MLRPGNSKRPQLPKGHRVLIGVVVTGAAIIAAIGFAGSYVVVREPTVNKGLGTFTYVLPVGIDAGQCVPFALALLLTWIRMLFRLRRQTAWLLTAATIAFNGAAAWPDPLGVGMHAIIPVFSPGTAPKLSNSRLSTACASPPSRLAPVPEANTGQLGSRLIRHPMRSSGNRCAARAQWSHGEHRCLRILSRGDIRAIRTAGEWWPRRGRCQSARWSEPSQATTAWFLGRSPAASAAGRLPASTGRFSPSHCALS